MCTHVGSCSYIFPISIVNEVLNHLGFPRVLSLYQFSVYQFYMYVYQFSVYHLYGAWGALVSSSHFEVIMSAPISTHVRFIAT